MAPILWPQPLTREVINNLISACADFKLQGVNPATILIFAKGFGYHFKSYFWTEENPKICWLVICLIKAQGAVARSNLMTVLQSLNWETLQSRRVNMRLCIIYKAYYNLAMFPLLDSATLQTVQTGGHNIKFILPHCSKDVYKHSFLSVALRGWNALPLSVVESATLTQFKASFPGATN